MNSYEPDPIKAGMAINKGLSDLLRNAYEKAKEQDEQEESNNDRRQGE